MATLECVGAGCLRQKLDRGRFTFFELPALLRRSKRQSGGTARIDAVSGGTHFETVIVVGGGDLELNFGACLRMDRRTRVFVLLRRNFNNLRVLTLGANRPGHGKKYCEAQKVHGSRG